MNDATALQVGGNHYIKLAIRPTEFAMRNGWDAASHAILKYVTRHADKGKLLDLQKAHHNVSLRAETRQPTWRERPFAYFNGRVVASIGFDPREDEDTRVSMEAYIDMNNIPALEARALTELDGWVRCQHSQQAGYSTRLKRQISDLALYHYGEAIE